MLGWTAGARYAGRWQYVCGALLLTGFIAGVAAFPASSDNAAAAGTGYSVALIQSGSSEQFTAVDPGTGTAYFGSVRSAQLTVVDGATGEVSGTINLGSNARGIAVDASASEIWVAEAGSDGQPGWVQAVDGSTNKIIATIPVSFAATGIAVDDATDTVYAGGSTAAAGDVAVIDGASDSVTTTIGTGTGSRPVALAADDTSDLIWVADQAGSVLVIDGGSDTITGTVSLAASEPVSVAVDPRSGRAYVVDRKNTDIAVIGGSPPAVIATIPLGANAFGIAIDPGTHTIFATANPTNSPVSLGTTWVVDTSNRTVTDTLTRGGDGVAVDQATGVAFEAAAQADLGGWAVSPAAANETSPILDASNNSATFTTGQHGSAVLAADALPAATFTEAGDLPGGVTLAADGTLAGTPAADSGGDYLITVTASNGVAPDSSQAFVLTVDQPTVFTSAASATFKVGTSQSFPLTSTGFPAVSVYSLASGTFPAGIGFGESPCCSISGTPAKGSGGVYHFVLAGTDGFGTVLGTQDFTLTVDQPPSFSSTAAVTFRAGRRASFTVKAAGFPVAALTEHGKLPRGVRFTAQPDGTATLAGSPASTARGHVFVLTLTATSSAGTASQTFRLKVS